MLARLLQHCVDEIATDGDAGSSPTRLFEFVAAFWDAFPADVRPTIDAPYREFIWRLVVSGARVGRADAARDASTTTRKTPAKGKRQSILERGRNDVGEGGAPIALPASDATKSLEQLTAAYGDDLRVYVDTDTVARVLTGSAAHGLSAAAYWVLQLVCRARAEGITVVQLGQITHYDQKTVFYLVKTLVNRTLIAKFAAPEAGHQGNLCVAQRFLHLNPQWQAQQSAAGADAADIDPTPVDVADLMAAVRDDEDDEDDALPPDGTSLLAYPLLSEQQTSVWLHSRNDLLTQRLLRMLRASPSYMTPRRFLPARLGLRSVPTLRRGFIAYIGRLVADGIVERVRVQTGSQRPLYVRATEKGLADGESTPDIPPSLPDATSWSVVREVPLERQITEHISSCGAQGCTMGELAAAFHASTDVKRMIETILVRQTITPGMPVSPLRLCAPFEQEGRERRIRYYTLAGFKEHCAREGLDVASALGFEPVEGEVQLPGEMQFADAAEYNAAIVGVNTGTVAFYRDVQGPVNVGKTKRGAPPDAPPRKRGRPRKNERQVKVEEGTEEAKVENGEVENSGENAKVEEAPGAPLPPPAPPAPAPAPADTQGGDAPPPDASRTAQTTQDGDAPPPPGVTERIGEPATWDMYEPVGNPSAMAPRRRNMTSFQRIRQLHRVVEHFGGVLDELDVPRCVKEYVDQSGEPDVSDLTDRTTRAKVVREAEQQGLLRTVKVRRLAHVPADGHVQRTVLYTPTLPTDTLHTFLRDVAEGKAGWGLKAVSKAPTLVDAPVAPPLPPAPWSSSARVTLGATDDPLLLPSTRAAFARVGAVLRQFYGFPHGPAARLREFHLAARAAAHESALPLDWFYTQAPLRTLVLLAPIPLRSRAVVRALRGPDAEKPLGELPERVRSVVARTKGIEGRIASYAAQLASLGVATVRDNVLQLAPDAGGSSLSTPEEICAFYDRLRSTARGSLPRDVSSMLAAPHAWQDSFALRRTQKLFLRRYTDAYAAVSADADASKSLVDRLAHVSFATPEAVAAFFSAARTRAPAQVLSQKVAERRAQRESEYAAACEAALASHQVPAEQRERVDRALGTLRRKYVWGREALSVADLDRLVHAAVTARRGRRAPAAPAARPVRRRTRHPVPWTSERQDLLRDAYVILHARHQHWTAVHAGVRAAPDWTAVLQLIRSDAELAPHASAAWNTWRSRLKQLARAPDEQVYLALLERAWERVSADARTDGSLDDPSFPDPAQIDLAAQIAFLRTKIDKQELVAQHEAASHATVLPAKLEADYIARWTPIAVPKAARVSDTAPVVHRLQALRALPATRTAAPVPHVPSAALHGVAEAAVRMIASAPHRSIDTAEIAAWIDAIGSQAIDAAIGRLVATRAVRLTDRTLAFGDEHNRAVQEPPLAAVMGDAAVAAAAAAAADSVLAGPTATDGETAAWIALLAAGATATLDTSPLETLRRRTHLNSRSLDDVETECVVTIRGSAPPTQVMPPSPASHGVGSASGHGDNDDDDVAATAAADALEQAGADGLPVESLDAADALAHGGALAVGYDCARIVHAKYADAWTVPTTGSGRVPPRLWRTLDGGVDMDAWRRALALVVGWSMARPGVSLARLVAHVRPALDRAEVCDVVDAASRAGVLIIRAKQPWHAQTDESVHVDVGRDAAWYVGAVTS
ncbi:oxalate--CoA ligase [Malassezia cuniculi]|uniref:Oxalate--CoA ligase n=1 Tax=Malassezia cuniculi TaxID=948313 RepID=A0AAF0EZ74_9BASI|nr:oxalate--CoA ligase [Malassezia cuniculi]